MNISDKGIKFLKYVEGVEHKAYIDSGGVATIGVGHTGPEVKLGLVWSDQQIEDSLKKDLKWAEDAVNGDVACPLNQNQYDALVSFVFNVGVHAFEQSTLLKLLNIGDTDGAMHQFMRWNMDNGHVVAGLTKRRGAEVALFNGTWST
jgi:lysozyme